MKFNKNEEAVSPVIGVILMVAITVILAAVIAVFVFGMADDIQTTHVVSVTAKVDNANSVIVTFQGGTSAGQLSSLNISVFNETFSTSTTAIPATWTSPNIGDRYTVAGTKKPTRLLVIGKFSDGAEQIILDKQL